jgi:hypothetical protein
MGHCEIALLMRSPFFASKSVKRKAAFGSLGGPFDPHDRWSFGRDLAFVAEDGMRKSCDRPLFDPKKNG